MLTSGREDHSGDCLGPALSDSILSQHSFPLGPVALVLSPLRLLGPRGKTKRDPWPGEGGNGGGRVPRSSTSEAASGRPEVPSWPLGAEHVLFIRTEDAGGQKKYLDVRTDLYFWKSYVSFSEERRARPISCARREDCTEF